MRRASSSLGEPVELGLAQCAGRHPGLVQRVQQEPVRPRRLHYGHALAGHRRSRQRVSPLPLGEGQGVRGLGRGDRLMKIVAVVVVAQGEVDGHPGGADRLDEVQQHGIVGRMALKKGRVAGDDRGGGRRIQGEDLAAAPGRGSRPASPRERGCRGTPRCGCRPAGPSGSDRPPRRHRPRRAGANRPPWPASRPGIGVAKWAANGSAWPLSPPRLRASAETSFYAVLHAEASGSNFAVKCRSMGGSSMIRQPRRSLATAKTSTTASIT